jgi:hypothetical protein
MRLPPLPRGQADGVLAHGCDLCGEAACCRYVVLQVSPAYQEREVSRWIELHGIKLVERNGALWAYIPTPCSALEDGRCSVYENRPKVCRDWPNSQADVDDLNRHLGRVVCIPARLSMGFGRKERNV